MYSRNKGGWATPKKSGRRRAHSNQHSIGGGSQHRASPEAPCISAGGTTRAPLQQPVATSEHVIGRQRPSLSLHQMRSHSVLRYTLPSAILPAHFCQHPLLQVAPAHEQVPNGPPHAHVARNVNAHSACPNVGAVIWLLETVNPVCLRSRPRVRDEPARIATPRATSCLVVNSHLRQPMACWAARETRARPRVI